MRGAVVFETFSKLSLERHKIIGGKKFTLPTHVRASSHRATSPSKTSIAAEVMNLDEKKKLINFGYPKMTRRLVVSIVLSRTRKLEKAEAENYLKHKLVR